MKVLNDILGYKDLKIYQDDDFFCFSLDSVILANYCNIRLSDKNICDLCTGNGVIPLILSKRTDKNIYCVEIQKNICDLAIESFKYNNVDKRISLFNCDIDDKLHFNFNEFFDLVLCNPPYFKVVDNSFLNLSYEKQIARHEVIFNLDKLFSVSKRILKNNGNLFMVHRPDRLLEIVDTMKKYNIEPKEIKFIYKDCNSVSKLILIHGQKNGKPGLKISSPLFIYNLDGSYSNEYNNIINEVRK